MVLVGLDPSFSRTGISVIDTNSKVIRITDVRNTIGKEKNFVNIFKCSLRVHKGIRDFIDELGIDLDYIVSEIPPPRAMFASGLYALDTSLFLDLIYRYPKLKGIYLLHPTYIAHLHGKKKYNKSESVDMAKKLFDIFTTYSYHISYDGRLSHDCAESFLFAVRLYVHMSEDCSIDDDERILEDITGVSRGFLSNKEQLLFSR